MWESRFHSYQIINLEHPLIREQASYSRWQGQTVQQDSGEKGQNYLGHIARQCTQPKRPRNVAWFKDKPMLAEALGVDKSCDYEVLNGYFLQIQDSDGQVVRDISPNNVDFQNEDLGTYDSDCDECSNAIAVRMGQYSNYGFDHYLLWLLQCSLYLGDSGCSKHMTGNHSQLMNFVSKFLGTVRFGNDQFSWIMRFGGLSAGKVAYFTGILRRWDWTYFVFC
ncbi:hypothetical protein Tco_1134249 [Tanacetum coccineum]